MMLISLQLKKCGNYKRKKEMKSQPFLLLKKEYLEVNLIVSVDGRLIISF